MANGMKKIQFNGLGSYTWTVSEAGNYYVESKSSIPGVNQGSSSQSSLVTTIQHNGSTIFTSQTGASSAYTNEIICAALDTLAVTYTSSNAIDSGLNAVKSQIIFASTQ